jgi:SAM-dependent methyltransferase
VLHVAPENCFERRFRSQPTLDYITGDLDAPADFRLDLTDALFESDSFDVILCLHVLEHIPDDAAAMQELHRMVRSAGLVFVDVPLDERDETYEPETHDPAERYRLLGQHDHVRFYGRADFRRRLQEAGFDVTVERLDSLSAADRKLYGLHDSVLHICRPKLAADRRTATFGTTAPADPARVVG